MSIVHCLYINDGIDGQLGKYYKTINFRVWIK